MPSGRLGFSETASGEYAASMRSIAACPQSTYRPPPAPYLSPTPLPSSGEWNE